MISKAHRSERDNPRVWILYRGSISWRSPITPNRYKVILRKEENEMFLYQKVKGIPAIPFLFVLALTRVAGPAHPFQRHR